MAGTFRVPRGRGHSGATPFIGVAHRMRYVRAADLRIHGPIALTSPQLRHCVVTERSHEDKAGHALASLSREVGTFNIDHGRPARVGGTRIQNLFVPNDAFSGNDEICRCELREQKAPDQQIRPLVRLGRNGESESRCGPAADPPRF